MDSNLQTHLVKTGLAGLAGWYLFGRVGGVLAAGANVGAYYLRNQQQDPRPWFQPKSLGSSWAYLKPRFSQIATAGLVWTVVITLTGGASLGPGTIRYLRFAARQGPEELVLAVGKMCVFQPIVQEIFYRGFVQEKIQDLQAHFGSDPASDENKRLRILAQGLLYGMTYYNPLLRANTYIVLERTLVGMCLGHIREEDSLQTAMLLHALINTCVVARVLSFGG